MATAAAIPATVWVGVKIMVPNATPDPVNVSLTDRQEVQWYSDTACVITFPNGSPFAETVFRVPAHGSVCSGPVTRGTKPCTITGCTASPGAHPGHYKYTISDTAGKVLVDPQVIVKP